jgi:TolB protein
MHHTQRICLVLCALLITSVAPVASARPAAAMGISPRLAFAAYRNGQWDLYSVDENGADLRQLMDDVHQDRDAAYSPDGTRLAFTSRRDRNWDVYILDLTTGQQTRVTRHAAYDGTPSWSPDGSQIAFVSYRAGNLDVWTVDLAGSALQNLTPDSPAGDFAPAWSPDGKQIAFTSWRNGDKDLFLLDVESGTQAQLTDSQAAEEWPAWSPDGRQLAFVRNWLGQREIYLMDVSAGSSAPIQITWFGRDDSPVWAPEGERLAFLNRRYDGEQMLWLSPGQTEQIPEPLTDVAWLDDRLTWNAQAIDHGTPVPNLADTQPSPLYEEQLTPSQSGDGEPWDLVPLADVSLPTADMTPYLSDRVDDSFVALRDRLADEVGYDFLGEMSEAYRPHQFYSDTSEYASWHKSGRAIDILFDYTTDMGQMLEIARDDMGGETFWRVFLRCSDQSGACGRPLTVNTWNWSHQARAEIAPDQGGVEKQVLAGYYVDLAALSREYGWTRISSWDSPDFSWTWHFKGFEYWHFLKADGLTWYPAVQEVIAPNKLDQTFTYDKMVELGDPPLLIALKGVPLPAKARLWWAAMRP